jgi:hypothetical protein
MMTATFAAPRFEGAGVRGSLRAMPAPVAVWYVLLVFGAALMALVALVVGLLGEVVERLAAAGWEAAATVRAAHPAQQPGPSTDSAPGSGPADFEVVI